jgi:dolichol-phosphate mannosyltransferase
VEFESSFPFFEADPLKVVKVKQQMQTQRAIIVIPTYNEKQNIQHLIKAIFELQIPNLDIMVVDDNSPDGTAEIVQSFQKENPNLYLLQREKKLGLGSAYVAGFQKALEQNYDYLFEMDADFSHDPKEVPNFLTAIQTNDLVIGSRYIHGVNVINWPLSRLFLSYGANVYTQIVTGMKIKDSTAGFKCYRREVLEAINLSKVSSDGYSFQMETNFKAWKKGFRIKEIPIVFVDRMVGTSKMSKKIIREAIWEVWRLRFSSLFRKF